MNPPIFTIMPKPTKWEILSIELRKIFEQLFLIFLVLKLTNLIDWSWWWVTAPLWIPALIAAFVLSMLIAKYIDNTKDKKDDSDPKCD